MLQRLLQMLNDSAWAYDQSIEQYAFVSPNIPSVLGVSVAEFTADKDLPVKLVISADRQMVLNAMADLATGASAELHYRIKIEGKTKWIFEKRTRFTNDDQHEIILSVLKDVTDQQAVTHYLKESLGDFRVLFDKNHNPMWIYEIPSLRIIKVNNAAIEHYGYSQEEFLDMTIRDVRPRLDLAAFNEYIFRKGITRGALHGLNKGGIWRHQNKNGEIIYAEITGHEIKFNNTTCRIIIATDVTDRVMYEQEMNKTEI